MAYYYACVDKLPGRLLAGKSIPDALSSASRELGLSGEGSQVLLSLHGHGLSPAIESGAIQFIGRESGPEMIR